MQIEVIYNKGRLAFAHPMRLKQDHLRLMLDVPDDAVDVGDGAALPAYALEDFPAEVREKVAALAEAARLHAPSGEDIAPIEETTEERQRWQAAELRNHSRLEQGRLP